MTKKKCVIVIPIYKEDPSEYDIASIRRTNVMLHNHDIVFVCPENLNIDAYSEFKNIKYVRFDDSYFKGIREYSRLCLLYEFYEKFKDYEYMMIVQTDCWIFRDEVDEWCEKGYDYIGAPIYSPLSNWPYLLYGRKPAVGNGGLSLRKISTMMRITNKSGYVYKSLKDEWDNEFEDLFICNIISTKTYLNIPEYTEAEKFSIDFPKNQKIDIIPMGCHRVFHLYHLWEPYINDLCLEKDKLKRE